MKRLVTIDASELEEAIDVLINDQALTANQKLLILDDVIAPFTKDTTEEQFAKAPAGDCEGLRKDIRTMIKNYSWVTNQIGKDILEQLVFILSRHPAIPKAHNDPATRWEESIREGEAQGLNEAEELEAKRWVEIMREQKPKAPAGLIEELKKFADMYGGIPKREILYILSRYEATEQGNRGGK